MELATEETKRNPLKIPKKLRDALNSLELPDLYSLLSDIEGYESPLVDINQFLEDKNYLGNILKDERGNSKIYPVWQEALNEVFPNPYFSPFTECISGDTIVDLLDGRSLTMREIHSLSKEQLYTISYDTSTKSFVPGKIKCSKSNGNKKVFRITLDNGKHFEATDNHLILARDNKYYKVADLEVGDSLMPYNIKLSPRGYRMVMDITSAKYRHLCTVMNEWKHGPILPGYMTHHKNFNKLDDRPHNLVTLTKDQHFIYHCVVNHNKWKDPVKAEQMRQRLREVHKIRFSDPKEKDRVSKHFKKLWKDDRSKLLEGIKKGHDNVKLRAQTDDSFAAKIKHTSIANISKYNADPNTIGDRIKRLDRGRNLLWGDPRYADARETISQKTRKHMLDGKAKMMNQKAIAKRRSDPALQEKHLAILANRNNDPDFQFKTRRNKILKQAYARYLDSGVIDYKNYDTVIKYFGSIKEYERSVKEYNHKIVSIEYIGYKDVYDLEIDNNCHNFVLNAGVIVHNCAFTGPIGAGKSFVGRMILFYDLYKLLMIKNPFDKYGMVSSDMIILALFTANLALADLVLYRPFREVIRQSPFFYGRMVKKNKLSGEKGEILFPNNVSIVAGSRFTHALGLAIFSGMLDEASFQIQSANTNQAYDSYLSMSRRMESRFMDYGGTIPGHLILISSKKDENAFLEKHIETNRTKDSFIVFDKPIWEIKRHTGIYSGITFPVFTGSALQSPRILDDTSIGKYPADKILQVPVEYKQRFIEDIQRSLMEIAGSTTVSNTKYIVQPEVITKSVKLVHCVNTPEIIIGFDDDVRIIEFIDTNKLRLYLGILETSPRYVHIDIGITHDALGFAMSTVCGAREVQRFDVEAIQEQSSGIVMRNEPIIRTELAISIRSLTQVPLWKIRDLITDLTELGFPITDVTCDSYQSTDTLQIMETMGYNTEVYSVDTDKKVAHIAFRNALYEGRSELPENPILIKELTELVDQGKKFDHPTNGTKDISDAVISSHYRAFTRGKSYLDIS